MQKLIGVAKPGPGEDSQLISLASTSVCRGSSRESLKEELERAIMSASIPVSATRPSSTPNLNRRMVQKECEVFEASGKRPANLQTLYEALLTIQPTSVEAESIQCMWTLCYKTPVPSTGFHNLCVVLYKEGVAEAVNIKFA